MSLTINQLQDRQSYINASEIAWVIHEFGNDEQKAQIPWLPEYCKQKTRYQFYCDKIATIKQLEAIQKATANESMQQGNLREQELFDKHLSKYFEKQPIESGYKNGILRATPDFCIKVILGDGAVMLYEAMLKHNVITVNNEGCLEIKLSGQKNKVNQLMQYHKWQCQQIMYCTFLDWINLAVFETESFNNASKEINVHLQFLFPDEHMLATIHDCSQKAMAWLESAKRGDFPVLHNAEKNKGDKIYKRAMMVR